MPQSVDFVSIFFSNVSENSFPASSDAYRRDTSFQTDRFRDEPCVLRIEYVGFQEQANNLANPPAIFINGTTVGFLDVSNESEPAEHVVTKLLTFPSPLEKENTFSIYHPPNDQAVTPDELQIRSIVFWFKKTDPDKSVGGAIKAFFKGIAKGVQTIWDGVTSVLNVIVTGVTAVFGLLLNAIAVILEFIFTIPIIGALLKWGWNIVLEAFSRIMTPVEAFLWTIGIRPEKKLRVCVINLREELQRLVPDEEGLDEEDKGLVAEEQHVINELQMLIDIYKEEANIRVEPLKMINFSTPFSSKAKADGSWIHDEALVSHTELLDIPCSQTQTAANTLLIPGTRFNQKMATRCFHGAFRRVTGIGAPITVFLVRKICNTPNEISSGRAPFFSSYVFVAGPELETVSKNVIAHECGHACGLHPFIHHPDPENLMYERTDRDSRKLTNGQAILMRTSRHVSYV